MDIHLINPNTTSAMTHSMCTSAQCVANANTTIKGITSTIGPSTIESYFDEAMSVVGIADAIQAGDQDGADGYILACFGDPCIDAARELTDKPVIGIAQASFIMASLISPQFTVITSVSRTIGMAEHLLDKYGMRSLCSGVLAVDMPVNDIESREATRAIINMGKQAKANSRTGAIVLGCGGMSGQCNAISNGIGLPVIDGVSSAVKLLECLYALGLNTSKQTDWAKPIGKLFSGELTRFGTTTNQSKR